MPQKRNPVACAAVLACAARTPSRLSTLLHAMPQEHERALGLWQAEWETLPEMFRLTAAALARSVEIAEGLVVDAGQMKANLNAQLGLTQAEAISVALASKLGRLKAHDLVRQAATVARDRRQQLAEVLKEMPEVTAHLGAEAIDRLLAPEHYLGSAQLFIDRVLESKEEKRRG